jgi:hypothetical protein
MTAHEGQAFLKQIEDVGRQVHARLNQFHEHGEFSDTHKEFLRKLKRQQAEIEAKIDAALEKGMSWEVIKLEFRRDFTGMMAELLLWEERLDAATMRSV